MLIKRISGPEAASSRAKDKPDDFVYIMLVRFPHKMNVSLQLTYPRNWGAAAAGGWRAAGDECPPDARLSVDIKVTPGLSAASLKISTDYGELYHQDIHVGLGRTCWTIQA